MSARPSGDEDTGSDQCSVRVNCSGGELRRHRTTCFLVDGKLAIDAGKGIVECIHEDAPHGVDDERAFAVLRLDQRRAAAGRALIELGRYSGARKELRTCLELPRVQWDDPASKAEAARLLGDAAQKVEKAGADQVLICTNTMHKLADTIQAPVRISLTGRASLACRPNATCYTPLAGSRLRAASGPCPA